MNGKTSIAAVTSPQRAEVAGSAAVAGSIVLTAARRPPPPRSDATPNAAMIPVERASEISARHAGVVSVSVARNSAVRHAEMSRTGAMNVKTSAPADEGSKL
jgi:hypothetical protein